MTDASQRYLDIVKHIVRDGQGHIAEDDRALLDRQRDLLGLSLEKATDIEQLVLRAYQKFLDRSRRQAGASQPSPNPAQGHGLPIQPQSAHAADPDYTERLEHYRQALAQAAHQQYPLDETDRHTLKQLQQSLNLDDSDVQHLEAELMLELQDIQEAHQAKCQWYEEEFAKAVEHDHHLDETVQAQLQQLQQNLRLDPEEVNQIEQRVLASRNAPSESIEPLQRANDSPHEWVNSTDPTHLPQTQPPDQLSPTELQPAPSRLLPYGKMASLPADYQELADCLQRQDWKQADLATLKLLLKLANREKQGWLNPAAIASLPCPDLHQIDRLWGESSNEQFSFRIQSRLYFTVGSPQPTPASLRRAAYKRGLDFSKKVGWWQSGAEFHKYYRQLTFDLGAPDGHLPALWYWKIPWWKALQFGGIGAERGGCRVDAQTLITLMTHLQDCGIT